MRTLILSFVFLLMSVGPSLALSTMGLTDQQIVELKLRVQQMQMQNDQIPEPVSEVKKLRALANELDMSIEDFLKSNLGWYIKIQMFYEINEKMINKSIGILWFLVALFVEYFVWKSMSNAPVKEEYVIDSTGNPVADNTGKWLKNSYTGDIDWNVHHFLFACFVLISMIPALMLLL